MTLTDSSFGTSSPALLLSTFFALQSNFLVSGDDNSNL